MSDLSILATELPSDPNASTFVADDLGKEHEGVSKSTMEQVNDSSLGGLLTTMTTGLGHSTLPSNVSPPTIDAAPDADSRVPEVPIVRDDEGSEVWIPKGSPNKPNGAPAQPARPTKPPKN